MTTIDIDQVFATKIAILISTDDLPQYQERKNHMLKKMQGYATINQIFDKNLASSDSIYQLLETQKINAIS